MLTYTYKCLDCGGVFDIKATIQEKEEGSGAKFACLKCHSKNIKQELSVVNFFKNVFKWWKKDCCCGDKSGNSCC